MITSRLADALTIALAVVALGAGAVTIRNEMNREPTRLPRASIEADWQRYASEGQSIGAPEAAVTIVEFADYQCPFCRQFTLDVDSLRKLGRSVRVVYRHLPARSHPHARQAARVSECASEQGRFEAMHAALNQHFDSIGIAAWKWFGNGAGIGNMPEFERCVAAETPVVSLTRDSIAAHELKVRGTPTLLVHQQRYDGLPPFDSLLAYVDRAHRKP